MNSQFMFTLRLRNLLPQFILEFSPSSQTDNQNLNFHGPVTLVRLPASFALGLLKFKLTRKV